jgi:hypothetical protein
MKIIKKTMIFFIFSASLLSLFMFPSYGQEWTYDGVDTQNIPSFSVFPSEWYEYQHTMFPPENLSAVEITFGNISDPGPGPGYCVWGNTYFKNSTSGELHMMENAILINYWNESIGYFGSPFLIPVEIDGKVSDNILGNASIFWESSILSTVTFENNQIYPNLYSIAFWNETYNNVYFLINYTDNGILNAYSCYNLPYGNLTLYSRPAQLPPAFSFAPELGSLVVNSTNFVLDIDIAPADNNNDGVTDTDYLMRHLQGSTWTSWGTPPSQLLWGLGLSAPAGNYTITIEIKNMYGVTQEQIEVQYEPSSEAEPPIPGYPTLFIAFAIFIGISFLIFKNRMKK